LKLRLIEDCKSVVLLPYGFIVKQSDQTAKLAQDLIGTNCRLPIINNSEWQQNSPCP